MQYALLIVTGAALGITMRRIVFWRRCGYMRSAMRLYHRSAWLLGGAAYTSMAVQEIILLLSGSLSWGTALPLHLCSLMGVLSLPMLLTRQRTLWHFSLYLGLPGAVMALLFPAILRTPWPEATALAFHTLHCAVVLSPLLPLSLGMQPSPWGAASSFLFLLLLACVATGVNALTGGNYLFLELPADGTPLSWMARHGLGAYRLTLAGTAAAALAAEGALVAAKGALPFWNPHARDKVP